jgi:DNA-binding HxlR family transcriptional regulator
LNLQNKLSAASENKVLKALMQKTPQTWSELKEATKISSRTLRKALLRLENQGKVFRKVEVGNKYPPPVLYGLTEVGKKSLTPILFSMYASGYILGLKPHYEKMQAETSKGEVKLKLPAEDEYAGLSLAERFETIGRRLFATKLFCLLEYLQTNNDVWLFEDIATGLPSIIYLLPALGIQETIKAQVKSKVVGELASGDLLLKFETKVALPQRAITQLQNAFQQAMPDEFTMLQNIYNNCLKEAENH